MVLIMMLNNKRGLVFLSVYSLLGIILLAPVAIVSASGEQFKQSWSITSDTAPSAGWSAGFRGDTIYAAGSALNWQTGKLNVLLEAYDTKGHYLWGTIYGSATECTGTALATSWSGIYIAGNTNNSGYPDKALLVKFSADGKFKWSTTWSVDLANAATAITVTYDSIYVVGYSMTPKGDLNVFLSKFSIFGKQMWTTTWGGSYDDVSLGVAVDALNNIYVVGITNTSSNGDSRGFMLKYNSFGKLKDSTVWGNVYDFATAVAVDGNDIYVIGASLIGYNLQAVIMSFNTKLKLQWSSTWGGSSEDVPTNLVIGKNDKIFVVGVTKSFGIGDWESFLLKFDDKGTLKCKTTWGNSGFDDCSNGIAIDGNTVYAVGYTVYPQFPILTVAAFK
jgi:hypothetical protein